MAINTAAKRKIVSGIPFAYSPGVTPDAGEGAAWRYAAAGSYYGLVLAIDSAEERRMAAGLLPFLPVSVTPNALKDAGWRAQAGWGFPLFADALGIATLTNAAFYAAVLADAAYESAGLDDLPL